MGNDNEPYDFQQGYYHVRADYADGHKPCVVDLAKLAEILPHGSGIDGDWHVQVRRNGNVRVTGEYHQMEENGYYNGWVSFGFTLARCTKQVIHPLDGPCAGQFQVTKVKGRVYLEAFTGGGRDNGDYLYEVVSCELSDKMGIHAIDSTIVASEAAALVYAG